MLKCNKFEFVCGSAPDPAGGAHSAPPVPLTVFKGPYRDREVRDGSGTKEEEGRECYINDLTHPLSQFPGYATVSER